MALWPGVIKSYDGDRRKVRIEVTGLTDGAELLPEADLLYALGDSHDNTEVQIKGGELVWIDFLANDERYPIIMGFRQPESGNITGIRRWQQDTIELIAGKNILLKAPDIKFECTALQSTGVNTFDKASNMDGGMQTTEGGAVASKGGLALKGGTITHNGIDIGDSHYHTAQGEFADTSTAK
ncbi:hypothetical protein AB8Q18_08265 [Neisseriaceae bacterium CLB008]